MLGEQIHDPLGIESTPGSSTGLGYLAMATQLQPHKQLQQRRGYLWDKHSAMAGYEIHCGISQGDALRNPACYLYQEEGLVAEGAVSSDGQIMGTYIHGIFDQPAALTRLLAWAGLHAAPAIAIDALREESIERLALAVEAALSAEFLSAFCAE